MVEMPKARRIFFASYSGIRLLLSPLTLARISSTSLDLRSLTSKPQLSATCSSQTMEPVESTVLPVLFDVKARQRLLLPSLLYDPSDPRTRFHISPSSG